MLHRRSGHLPTLSRWTVIEETVARHRSREQYLRARFSAVDPVAVVAAVPPAERAVAARAAAARAAEAEVLALVVLEAVLALTVQAPEVVPLAVVQVPAEPVLASAPRRPEVVAQVVEALVRVALVVELLALRVVQPRALAGLERAARPVQGRQAWEAAEVEPLRPASAVAQQVPVSLEPSVEMPLAALAHRVRSSVLQFPDLFNSCDSCR